MQYSVGLYAELARETGKDPGWHELGGLRLACSPERDEEIRRQAGWAKTFGLPLEIVSAQEAQAMFPLMSTDGVLSAAFLPHDGYLDPSQLTFALADGARRLGAEIAHAHQGDRHPAAARARAAVETDKGEIETEIVVAACGIYTPDVARLVDVQVPIIPFGHQYLVTEPFDPPLPPLPTLRDPDHLVYFRTEVGGLVQGGYERDPFPWALDGVPEGFEAALLTEDPDRFEELSTNAIHRVPAMETAQVKRFFNGPEAFTPDGEFSSASRACPASGSPPASAPTGWPAPAASARSWPSGSSTASRSTTSGTWTSGASAPTTRARPTRWPARTRRSRSTTTSSTRPTSAPARGRCGSPPPTPGSPSSARRSARRPAGSARLVRVQRRPRRRGPAADGLGGAQLVARHRRRGARHPRRGRPLRPVQLRQDRGRRPRRARLPRAAVRQHDRPARRHVVYTQLLNPRGGIECDLSVMRLAERPLPAVTGTAFGDHDRRWIERHLPDDGRSTCAT